MQPLKNQHNIRLFILLSGNLTNGVLLYRIADELSYPPLQYSIYLDRPRRVIEALAPLCKLSCTRGAGGAGNCHQIEIRRSAGRTGGVAAVGLVECAVVIKYCAQSIGRAGNKLLNGIESRTGRTCGSGRGDVIRKVAITLENQGKIKSITLRKAPSVETTGRRFCVEVGLKEVRSRKKQAQNFRL